MQTSIPVLWYDDYIWNGNYKNFFTSRLSTRMQNFHIEQLRQSALYNGKIGGVPLINSNDGI